MPVASAEPALETSARFLALDEAVLGSVEAGHRSSALRFWESKQAFVVLGMGQQAAREANLDACAEADVPVLRRCSGGGCVLQGPGSLNFTLALRYDAVPEVRQLRESYCYVLHALEDAFARHGLDVRHRGICDLAWGPWKVSGNAQRRRSAAMLHHGTLLHAVDYGLMGRCLREPEDRPDYRGGRVHGDFVRALPLGAEALKNVVRDAFSKVAIEAAPSDWETEQGDALVRSKYSDPAWNLRR